MIKFLILLLLMPVISEAQPFCEVKTASTCYNSFFNANNKRQLLEKKLMEFGEIYIPDIINFFNKNYQIKEVFLNRESNKNILVCDFSKNELCNELLAKRFLNNIFNGLDLRDLISSDSHSVDPKKLMLADKLYLKIITPTFSKIMHFLKPDITKYKTTKLFEAAKLHFVEHIQSLNLSKKNTEMFIQKIQRSTLNQNCFANKGSDYFDVRKYGLLNFLTQYYHGSISYNPTNNISTVNLCGNTGHYDEPLETLAFVIFHELAHNIDACQFPYIWNTYQSNQPQHLQPDHFDQVTSCLRSNKSTQAQTIGKNFFKKFSNLIRTEPLTRKCRRTHQLGEVSADWMATELVSSFLKNKFWNHEVFSKSRFKTQANNALSIFCRGIHTFNKSTSTEAKIHPTWNVRLNDIFLAHPKIRSYLDCKLSPRKNTTYCEYPKAPHSHETLNNNTSSQ